MEETRTQRRRVGNNMMGLGSVFSAYTLALLDADMPVEWSSGLTRAFRRGGEPSLLPEFYATRSLPPPGAHCAHR